MQLFTMPFKCRHPRVILVGDQEKNWIPANIMPEWMTSKDIIYGQICPCHRGYRKTKGPQSVAALLLFEDHHRNKNAKPTVKPDPAPPVGSNRTVPECLLLLCTRRQCEDLCCRSILFQRHTCRADAAAVFLHQLF